MSLGVFLRVWKRVWAGRPPPPSTLQGIAPLTSSSVTENTEVIDQRLSRWRRGWIPAPAQLGETLARFFDSAVTLKRSTCWNNAGRAAVFSPPL